MERDNCGTITGASIGASVGALGGPAGASMGASIGARIGILVDETLAKHEQEWENATEIPVTEA